MHKLFIAFKIPENNEIIDLQDRLRKHIRGKINWVRPELMHMTLRFIGKWDDIHAIIDRVEPVVSSFPCFSIETNGQIKYFSSGHGIPRVLYADFSDAEHLYHLNQQIDDALSDLPVYTNRKKFVPHITLVRINKISDKVAYFIREELSGISFTKEKYSVHELILMNSIQDRQGLVYKPEYRLKLKSC